MYTYDRQLISSQYAGLGQIPFFEPEPSPPPVLTKGAIRAGREHITVGVQRAKAKARPALSTEKTCWIQTVLNKASGENLVPDGLYGPKTRAAVGRFQARSGLSANGIVDARTNTALIQIGLNQIAQASLVPIEGVMDARTRQETIRFQAAK